jgi:hypothetical protein
MLSGERPPMHGPAICVEALREHRRKLFAERSDRWEELIEMLERIRDDFHESFDFLEEEEFRNNLAVIVRGTPGGYGLTEYHIAAPAFCCGRIRLRRRAIRMSQGRARAQHLER